MEHQGKYCLFPGCYNHVTLIPGINNTEEEQYMKNIFSLLTIASLLIVLSACGKPAKETYMDAHQGFMDAKTYEGSSTINIDLQSEGAMTAPGNQMALGLINNAEIKADIVSNTEKGITEMVLHVKTNQGPMSFNLDVPLHINMKEQKVYMKTETLKKAVSMAPGFPVSLQFDKKFINLSSHKEIGNFTDETRREEFNRIMMDMIKSLPEEQFSQEENDIQVTIQEEQMNDFIISLMKPVMKENSKQTQDTMIQDLEKELENVSFEKVSMETTIKDNQLTKQSLSLEMKSNVKNQKGSLTVDVTNQYKSINEDVEFTMNPTKENTLTTDELNKKMNQLMKQSMPQGQ